MDIVVEWLPMMAMMLLTGAVGGILAGLLGVGGGIVIVPVLDIALGIIGVDEAIRMHIAVATSLATIVPTSISSSRAHYAKGAVDLAVIKFWGPFIFVGAMVGVWLASQVDSTGLSMIFGFVALTVAIKMMLPLEHYHISEEIPRNIFGPLAPLAIGGLSSMMGIGGGALSVPVLTLMNQAIHRAVGTAALFGLLISAPAAVAYMVSGFGDTRLPPGSLGYVNVLGFALISPATVLAAPFGARLAHRLGKRHLSLLFGAFLLVVSLRMLYRAFLT